MRNQPQDKAIVYQLFVRLFGNKVTDVVPNGTITENGCGKFEDIDQVAINSILQLGTTHVWLTGVLDHASLTGYPEFGIEADHPSVVKGNAGSPYAIKDYYNVSPDLAKDPANRLTEFKACIALLQANGLKVIIDFVPNHVARQYHGNSTPKGIKKLGEEDDQSTEFAINNNFYYLPGTTFQSPETSQLATSPYIEIPAKATGDNFFGPNPHLYNWYETAKLNYGYLPGSNSFVGQVTSPPNTWVKVLDIIKYWIGLGVDGFRCDMIELVPDQFWVWLIDQIKTTNPNILWIGEAYELQKYGRYLHHCGFDWLYDKAGFYDLAVSLANGEPVATNWDDKVELTANYSGQLLRFIENHDEVRIAGQGRGTAVGFAAFLLVSTAATGPIMLYNGQEVGEKALGESGFSGDDGKTTIFDYWNMPAVQRWFDPAKSPLPEEIVIRENYQTLLTVLKSQPLFESGSYYGLQYANKGNSWDYDERFMVTYIRHAEGKAILVTVNFLNQAMVPHIKIPWEAWHAIGLHPERNFKLVDLLNKEEILFSGFDVLDLRNTRAGVQIPMEAHQGRILEIVSVD